MTPDDRVLALRHQLQLAEQELRAAARTMRETWMRTTAGVVESAADRARDALAHDAQEHGT